MNWSKVIWFKHAVHRWSIIQWMTVLGSLSTRDRLLKLGMLVDARAQLQMRLTKDLFFQCSFLSQVWKSVQQRLRPPCPFNDLPQIMGWMVQLQHGTDTQFHLSLLWLILSTMLGENITEEFSRLLGVMCISWKPRF